MKTSVYRINNQEILFEEFEDETVLVNTESGFYYSLSRSGTHILRLLQYGCAVEALSLAIFGRLEDKTILREIEDFVAKLIEEKIIVACSRQEAICNAGDNAMHPFLEAGSFVAPVLERFDDVRELLLIDPVHQVDQQYGWPKAFRNEAAPEVASSER